MKRLCGVLTALLLLMTLCLPAAAIPSVPSSQKVYDFADLLTQQEEAQLVSDINRLIERYGIDIAVVTTNDSEGKSPVAYADDFYDQNGFAPNGLLLYINLTDRDVYISTCGTMIDNFSDNALDSIISSITPDLSGGNYANAVERFLGAVDNHLQSVQEGRPSSDSYGYSDDGYSYSTATPMEKLGISAMFGFLGALIASGIMLFSHKSSLASPPGARSYLLKNGVNVTGREDRFVNTNTIRTPIPRDNNRGGGGFSGGSSHISSGGISHGGRGGKF